MGLVATIKVMRLGRNRCFKNLKSFLLVALPPINGAELVTHLVHVSLVVAALLRAVQVAPAIAGVLDSSCARQPIFSTCTTVHSLPVAACHAF